MAACLGLYSGMASTQKGGLPYLFKQNTFHPFHFMKKLLRVFVPGEYSSFFDAFLQLSSPYRHFYFLFGDNVKYKYNIQFNNTFYHTNRRIFGFVCCVDLMYNKYAFLIPLFPALSYESLISKVQRILRHTFNDASFYVLFNGNMEMYTEKSDYTSAFTSLLAPLQCIAIFNVCSTYVRRYTKNSRVYRCTYTVVL